MYYPYLPSSHLVMYKIHNNTCEGSKSRRAGIELFTVLYRRGINVPLSVKFWAPFGAVYPLLHCSAVISCVRVDTLRILPHKVHIHRHLLLITVVYCRIHRCGTHTPSRVCTKRSALCSHTRFAGHVIHAAHLTAFRLFLLPFIFSDSYLWHS